MPSINQFKSREEYNAWYRAYRKRNREKLRAYNLVYNKKRRKKFGYTYDIDYAQVRSQKYPKKHSAITKLNYAKRTGKVIQRDCLYCNSSKTVAHHPNYDLPLEVIWVCALHHKIMRH